MGLYQDLCMLKANGELFEYEDISDRKQQDARLHIENNDGIIEELFYIKRLKNKILFKPKKLSKSIKTAILDDFLQGRSERSRKKNLQVKQEILKNENLNMISKAITHFVFQNGPIKGMLACRNKQLSEIDLAILNKFMVNRLSYVFRLIVEERWIEFDFLVRNINEIYGHDWEEVKPDDGGTRKLIEMMLEWKAKSPAQIYDNDDNTEIG